MIVDRQGTVLQVNEAFEVMFEAPRVRVVGQRFTDLLATGRRLGIESGRRGRPRWAAGAQPRGPRPRDPAGGRWTPSTG